MKPITDVEKKERPVEQVKKAACVKETNEK
jgi:hypothetical protein